MTKIDRPALWLVAVQTLHCSLPSVKHPTRKINNIRFDSEITLAAQQAFKTKPNSIIQQVICYDLSGQQKDTRTAAVFTLDLVSLVLLQ